MMRLPALAILALACTACMRSDFFQRPELAAPPILAGGAAVAQPGPIPSGPLGPPLSPAMLQADLVAKTGSDTIRFERDSYALGPAARALLDRQAVWLRLNPLARVSLEGHGDGRQTREYAIALGARRAAAVRDFLLTQGIPPAQLSIVSWGKERPQVEGAHDATWLQNSRVRLVVQPPAF